MKVVGLGSFFDEQPAHLDRCVTSAAKVCDHFIAVDGRYEHFPASDVVSAPEQHEAIRTACDLAGIGCTIWRPSSPWTGEIEKRAAMFRIGLAHTEPMKDWFLIMDADEVVAEVHEDTRAALEAEKDCDSAEVLMHNIRPDGHVMDANRFRKFYRSVPGLTVKWTHYLYCVQTVAATRFLWHTPNGHQSQEPSLNLTGLVTMHHRQLDRDPDRAWASRQYYKRREELVLERPPRY